MLGPAVSFFVCPLGFLRPILPCPAYGAFSVKLLNYTLAGVIGASIATLAAYRVSNFRSVSVVVAPAVARHRPPSGPSSLEFARLTREKADLDAQLAEARAKLAEHDATLAQTKQSLEELRRPMMADLFSSSLRAELKSGEVVVTGGYKLPNGKRLYAFAQPVIQQVDGADVVKIESRFLATTDEVGKSLGLDTIATNAANTLQHGEVWVADEQASVWSKLDAASGSDFVEMRAITVPSSGSGVIQCGTLQLKVSPVVSADHSNMDFEVRLEQPQTPAPVETKADAGAVQ